MIQFYLPFRTKPKQSFRYTNKGHRYTPVPVKRNAEALALLASKHRPAEPLKGPLSLRLIFTFPWRISDTRRITLWKDTTPDWDNLSKQVCDVLQSTGFYRNDSQLACVCVEKQWADSYGVQITLWRLNND